MSMLITVFSNKLCDVNTNQDSELFMLGGDLHKKKKRHSDDYYYRGEMLYYYKLIRLWCIVIKAVL